MRERGFTLIEIAVVLAIVSIVTVGLLKAYGAIRTNRALEQTRDNQAIIVTALRTFLAQNNRLPCAAIGTLPFTDAAYGSENCVVPPDLPTGAPAPRPYRKGVLPWVDLGLQGEERFDGAGRQFTYVVLDRATDPNAFSQVWEPIDARITDPGDVSRHSDLVVVIISHGLNGSGAFTLDGNQLAAPVATALAELDNTLNDDLDFMVAEYSEHAVTPYDDIVRGYTEAQLIAPLVSMEVFTPRDVETRRRLARIENALLGYAITDIADPDGDPGSGSGLFGCSCFPITNQSWCDMQGPGAPVSCTLCPALPDDGCRTTSNGLPVSSTPPPTGPLGLQMIDGVDAWGTNIVYVADADVSFASVCPGPCRSDVGLYRGATADPAFSLQSFGPDGAPNGCGGDDICIDRRATDLVGRIANTGNPVY